AINTKFLNALFHDVTILALILLLLRRRGMSWSDIGIAPRWSDIPWSFAIVPAAWVAGIVMAVSIYAFSVLLTGRPATYWQDTSVLFGRSLSTLAVAYAVVNPFFEEIVCRGYLMTEVWALTNRAWVAFLFSVSLQSIVHIYQGWTNVFHLAAMFAVLAGFFAFTRRLLPVILAHLWVDLLAVAQHFRHH